VACASTGNTSASAAAYAARAGLACVVVLPAATSPWQAGQAIRHGARVVCVEGAFDAALEVVRAFTAGGDAVLVNSVNPTASPASRPPPGRSQRPGHGARGPGPAGGQRREHHRLLARLPGDRGGSPHVGFPGRRRGSIVHGAPVAHPETVAPPSASATPPHGRGPWRPGRVGGIIEAVTDEQILAPIAWWPRRRVFAEPASAASVPGSWSTGTACRRGRWCAPSTGHGLKDPQVALRDVPELPVIRPSAGALREWLGW